ncbi:hypothetical protein SAMN05443572_102833 [Myxococcus fulvus]|uniref:Lipoprotein n=1 Tax=Myxococcus fulvus TaxID=33 RepID=A0A511SX68_MYXFU|nr:hypothetical protein [Myxococcus fulvus]AKF83519.1 hypothetical protein MFUL124B02_35405 [Myxococcus fulvus 124B02]GEN06052.1 hypothetical protein MFU01_10890 [Myxococcus fulvus]SET59919.1 hypothetical protein SAMN05443572_102833 [Myxococcus fulvus]
MKARLSIATLVAGLLVASTASAAITVRYSNRDSRDYTWSAVCSGVKTRVSFGKDQTASLTIPGSGPCTVQTDKGKVVLKGGEDLDIKDGGIVVK